MADANERIVELLEKQDRRERKKEREQQFAGGCLLWLVVVPMILLLGTCAYAVLFYEDEGKGPNAGVSEGRCPLVRVTREHFGDRWPLTVEAGDLWCIDCLAAVFRDPSTNTLYALNGVAKSHGAADIRPIWRDDPSGGAFKVNIGVLIDLALKKCR